MARRDPAARTGLCGAPATRRWSPKFAGAAFGWLKSGWLWRVPPP